MIPNAQVLSQFSQESCKCINISVNSCDYIIMEAWNLSNVWSITEAPDFLLTYCLQDNKFIIISDINHSLH